MERRNACPPCGTPRRGFTLVELLVVIIIIAILAALAVPAVMRATSSAQNARIKTEIDMLHQAIMQYKNEYGSFPPCVDMVGGVNGPVNKHLRRLFPRCDIPALPNNATVARIQPDTAIRFWLSGFTPSPTDPLGILDSTLKRKKYFDFDEARVDAGDRYTAPSKPKSPFIYIDASNYDLVTTAGGYASLGNTYLPFKMGTAYANPETFQILSAGRDEKFGTDDDLSNFWPGTRKDYLDSLK